MTERWIEHYQAANRGVRSKFYNAIRKYGIENWSHVVLITDICDQDGTALEIIMIEKYNTFIDGYNTTIGGDGLLGLQRSDEHCKRISQSLTGKEKSKVHRQNISDALRGKPGHPQSDSWHEMMKHYKGAFHPMYGKTHSVEAKIKISKSSQGKTGYWEGKKLSTAHREKIAISLTGTKRGSYTIEHRRSISESLTGRTCSPMSEEQKQKIGLANRGRKRSDVSARNRAKIVPQKTSDTEL